MKLIFLLLLAAWLTACATNTQTRETITPDGVRVIERQTVIIVDFSTPVSIPKPKWFSTARRQAQDGREITQQ